MAIWIKYNKHKNNKYTLVKVFYLGLDQAKAESRKERKKYLIIA